MYVGYPGFDLIGLLVGNEMRALSGHRCRTTGPMGQRIPYRESVKGSSRPYIWSILMDYEYLCTLLNILYSTCISSIKIIFELSMELCIINFKIKQFSILMY